MKVIVLACIFIGTVLSCFGGLLLYGYIAGTPASTTAWVTVFNRDSVPRRIEIKSSTLRSVPETCVINGDDSYTIDVDVEQARATERAWLQISRGQENLTIYLRSNKSVVNVDIKNGKLTVTESSERRKWNED